MPEDSPALRAMQEALDRAQQQNAQKDRRLAEVTGQLRAETGTRFAAQTAQLGTEIATLQQQGTILEDRAKTLLEEGSFADAAKTQREIAQNEARLLRLQEQKDYLEGQKSVAERQPADPLANFNTTEREWIEKNPAYLSDDSFREKVNAAAYYAREIKKLPKDSPEYFRFVEEEVGLRQATVADAGEVDPDPMAISLDSESSLNTPDDQARERGAPIAMPQQNAPSMSVELRPENPQERAVGRGNGGAQAVAAPPSRRIAQANQRNSRGSTRIEPTPQEAEIAIQLYGDIYPDAEDKSPEAAVRWYHAFYTEPRLHQGRRRSRWVYGHEGASA